MSKKSRSGMSADLKNQLVARMKKKTTMTPRVVAAPVRERLPHFDAGLTDFSKHPDYEQIQLQTLFADHTQMRSPYFRDHNSRAGAVSEIDDQAVVNFGSYDYLGLNHLESVGKAAQTAIDVYGTSVSASRVVAGERGFHRDLEKQIAEVYETDDAITYVSGHATNVSTIATLLGPGDLVLHDAWAHNSVKEGAKLSGATIRNFAHNDPEALETILKSSRHQYARVLIVIEGLYSMDGDTSDLAEFVEIKKRYQAWLMVDEAHSLGVLGETGRGIAEEQNVPFSDVDIWMGTMSKTLASCGGYIAGCRQLITLLKFKAPGFVYSVGLSAPAAAAAMESLRIMKTQPQRVKKLREISAFAFNAAKEAGIDTGVSEGYAVIPIMIRDAIKAVVVGEAMLSRGYNMLPIIYPAVPMKESRLRLFITAEHTREQIQGAIEALKEEIAKVSGSTNKADASQA
ncbi:MAG: aminotransferase class I/II-fold pyridoxal phosphate-dependent enzyme [Hyphomicrobiales bacterium]